ncbi:MAG: bifunctional UDP-sugar hydrolase/5'-nucleotidase [Pseudomonadota bacterium]
MHFMRVLSILIAVFFVACSSVPPPSPKPLSPSPIEISILTINDFHGQLTPISLDTNETPPRSFSVGGVQALAVTIAELRSQNPTGTLLLDAGDFMQGSLLSNSLEGLPVRAFYSLIGVVAAAIGNHEFDYGPQGPSVIAEPQDDGQGALKEWAKRAPFPLLTANIRDKSGNQLSWPNVRASTIVERKGVRIGIVGLTTLQTPFTTMPSNVANLQFQPLQPALLREIELLRKANVDAIVAVGHLNGECETKVPETCRGEMFDLLESLPEKTIDAFVAGHGHQCIQHRFRGTLVTEACSQGKAVGHIKLVIIPGKGVVHEKSRVFPPTPVCHQVFDDTNDCEGLLRTGIPKGSLIPNPLLAKHRNISLASKQIIKHFRSMIPHHTQRVLAMTNRPLHHDRYGFSDLGFLFANILQKSVPGVDFALINSGSIRAEIPAGPITYERLYQVFPFDNQIATVELTGKQLHQMLENSLNSQHSGLTQVAGLRLWIRCGASQILAKLTDSRNKPLNFRKTYRVVLSDYAVTGGGALGKGLFRLPFKIPKILTGRFIRDEVAQYLVTHPNLLTTRNNAFFSHSKDVFSFDGPCSKTSKTGRYLCR